jgi:hypothetical protein
MSQQLPLQEDGLDTTWSGTLHYTLDYFVSHAGSDAINGITLVLLCEGRVLVVMTVVPKRGTMPRSCIDQLPTSKKPPAANLGTKLKMDESFRGMSEK